MCTRQTTSKYLNRPSPAYPANECCGSVKVGNDGQLYKSTSVGRQTACTWKRINGGSNGARSRGRKSSRKSSRSHRPSRSRRSGRSRSSGRRSGRKSGLRLVRVKYRPVSRSARKTNFRMYNGRLMYEIPSRRKTAVVKDQKKINYWKRTGKLY